MRKPRKWDYAEGVDSNGDYLAVIRRHGWNVGINHIRRYARLWKRAVRILNAAEAKPKRARRKK